MEEEKAILNSGADDWWEMWKGEDFIKGMSEKILARVFNKISPRNQQIGGEGSGVLSLL